jgi:hypothetical protein
MTRASVTVWPGATTRVSAPGWRRCCSWREQGGEQQRRHPRHQQVTEPPHGFALNHEAPIASAIRFDHDFRRGPPGVCHRIWGRARRRLPESATPASAASAGNASKPKLLVVISVDQRFVHLFAEYRQHFTAA